MRFIWSDTLTVLGLGGLLGGYIMFVVLFFWALMNGGQGHFIIDKFNEKYFELGLIALLFPFIVVYIYREVWLRQRTEVKEW